jgi:hypothetical protein
MIHTKKMRDSHLLGADVDLKELAAQAKNFSGAGELSLMLPPILASLGKSGT